MRLQDSYVACRLCPRNCGVPRFQGSVPGYCGETGELRIAAASLHRGEEPPVTGMGGSGTIFITGCSLGCVFCQNYRISREGAGAVVSGDEFARICLVLEDRGAENINIVTGSHAIPAIIMGIRLARSRGLSLPVFWNSSAYESPGALSLLEDTVDVYLPDLKTLDSKLSRRFFNAPDYPEHAERAIFRMLEVRGKPRYAPARGTDGGEDRVLVSGVIIRHLALPDHLESTREVLRWFAEKGRGRALFSLMTQYTPVMATSPGGPPGRCIDEAEYERVLRWLEEFEIEDGFYQELVHDTDWLPDFEQENPFSSELSLPVWHWKQGFI
ncbi:MAG: radical SAM protein [Spirochaetaceae bacterium]|nr:radical SAM protein [Spirochaetaceae bacterium]